MGAHRANTGRPSSAGAATGRSSSHRAASEGPAADRGAAASDRPSSAGADRSRNAAGRRDKEKADRPNTAEGRDSTVEERWAAVRMEKLRQELIELDKCDHPERKKGLRRLQRELHPDKQPPELRVHAQPLFHMVQREWELLGS